MAFCRGCGKELIGAPDSFSHCPACGIENPLAAAVTGSAPLGDVAPAPSMPPPPAIATPGDARKLPPHLRPQLDAIDAAYERWREAADDYFSESKQPEIEAEMREGLVTLLSGCEQAGLSGQAVGKSLRRRMPLAVGHTFFESAVPSGGRNVDVLTGEEIPDSRLRGIGGWLVLPAIGLVLGPVISIVSILNALAAGTFGAQSAYQSFLVIVVVVAGIRFFTRKRDAPYFMIATYSLSLVGSILAAMQLSDTASASVAPFLLGSIAGTLVWIVYFCVSKRVKATFVE
jgi:hypothetical protein